MAWLERLSDRALDAGIFHDLFREVVFDAPQDETDAVHKLVGACRDFGIAVPGQEKAKWVAARFALENACENHPGSFEALCTFVYCEKWDLDVRLGPIYDFVYEWEHAVEGWEWYGEPQIRTPRHRLQEGDIPDEFVRAVQAWIEANKSHFEAR